jgi:predicted N-acyltransferase
MLSATEHTTIRDLDRAAWDALFPSDPEGWAFYLACEEAPLAGFDTAYVAVRDGAGKIVALAPLFHTRHQLYASLSGALRRAVDALARRFPSFLTLGVTGLGSPQVDRCHIGFDANLASEARAEAVRAIVATLAASARRRGHRLLAVKDLEQALPSDIGATLETQGFAKIRSLPNAYLPLPYVSWDAFLKSRSRSDRRYFTRKERPLEHLRIEWRQDIGDLSPDLHALYEQTRGQSKGDYGAFEMLHPEFFAAVSRHCGDNAQFMLCWQGDKLVGFQLLMLGAKEMVARVIGMDYAVARELNLYFINVNQAIRLAIERGIPGIRMGNTAYAVKLVYGGQLATHWIYFRHPVRSVNWLLRKLAPLIDYERHDPDLIRLRQQHAAAAAKNGEKTGPTDK